MSSAKTYICLDIGGTYIKHGLLTETGEILIKGKIPTRAKEGGQAVFEQAVELVEGYLEKKKTSAISEKETDFLRVDREEPFTVSLDERPDTEKHSESDFIRQTQVETDLSEADEIAVEMQDHTGSRINLCLTVGTGIGGCPVVDGKVFHGASNSACEVGYMHLATGAFQDEAATSVLVRRVTERKKAEVWDGFRIFEAAKAGDPICQEELDRLADLLGMGIANICFVINPERIILGGGIMEQEAYMKPRIEAALEKYLVPQIWKHTTVCMAAYQNNAGMLGALYHLQAELSR